MKRTFKYAISANRGTISNAERWLELCRFLYNCALRERIDAYRDHGRYVSYFDQTSELKGIKHWNPDYQGVNVQMMQTVLDRLDKTYKAFFRGHRKGGGSGFPRFKGVNRYDSLVFKANGWKVNGTVLSVTEVGSFKMMMDRPIQGTIKTMTLKRRPSGRWFACFSCDNVPERRLESNDSVIGIDVGIKNFCVDSSGMQTANPKFFSAGRRLLRIRQSRWNRRVKGSVRKAKAKLQVVKVYEKTRNQRLDFLHKLSTYYVHGNGVVCVEDLKIRNMLQNRRISRYMSDATWGIFIRMLSYKAEEAGRVVVKVPPHNTSQNCSQCGKKVEKSLAVRTHSCSHCGLVMDRDENAARNILALGQRVQALT